jgi:hypothetical protein
MLTVEQWWEVFNKMDSGGYVKCTYGTLKDFEAAVRAKYEQEKLPMNPKTYPPALCEGWKKITT